MTVLLIFVMAAAITLFIMKARNPSAYWMALVLLGWFLSMAGLVLFLAKYGGFYYKVNQVLFFTDDIRNWLLHSPLSIGGVSRMISIGRSLFIFSLLGLSISLYYYKPFREGWKWYVLSAIFPLGNVFFYEPVVYKRALGMLDREFTYTIGWLTRGWLIASAAVAIALLLMRYKRTTVHWIKKQLQSILLGVFSLVLFYFYLGFMGPLQVFDVRTYYVLYSDFSNFNPPLKLFEWYLSIGLTGISSLTGIIAIWKYTKIEKQLGNADLQLDRKLKTANMGAKVFTHAIKNQLLMIQLLIRQVQEPKDSSSEEGRRKEQLDKVSEIVNQTLYRLDQLYNSFKTSQLQLRTVSIQHVIGKSLNRLGIIPGHVTLQCTLPEEEITILADEAHLTEALYNLIVNALEAMPEDRPGELRIVSHVERNWLIVNVADNGSGIPHDQLEAIFDPFFTSKNTTRNWGVGLSYARQVVQGHFGRIQAESKLGVGSEFHMLLPVYYVEKGGDSDE
ncbi:ATP-binding protein [Paenibacillus cymbidii]|uniref:ATP-binding protein n=1 Tax=Paenibacillus cymbidii TaxID=1639034 RepID=UPI001436A13D|nr:ATP-binding protein [Paenibacillus cymbidii]